MIEPKVSITWPRDQLRARRVITRRPTRLVTKHPSSRLGRMVHAESRVEVLAASVLDCDPRVIAYTEQPFTIQFRDQGRDRWHVPDFLIRTPTGQVVWEIKRAADPRISAATQRAEVLTPALADLGYTYRVVTDHMLEVEPAISNARVLNRLACSQLDVIGWEKLRRWFEKIRSISWAEIASGIHGRDVPYLVARSILDGKLHVDLTVPLRAPQARIYFEPTSTTGLERPWASLL